MVWPILCHNQRNRCRRTDLGHGFALGMAGVGGSIVTVVVVVVVMVVVMVVVVVVMVVVMGSGNDRRTC